MKHIIKIIGITLAVIFSGLGESFAQNNSSGIKVLNESNFTKNTKKGVVLVDFYADWCGPCKMMHPVLEELAVETSGKIKFFKVNIDNANELAAKYNIRSIPCLIVFKNGREAERFVGFQQKETLLLNLGKFL
ncbi:MAG TPA: thioredoxin [Bacteroidales bacterium]|nr:thioredoxin [Bacteroidales bacterium]